MQNHSHTLGKEGLIHLHTHTHTFPFPTFRLLATSHHRVRRVDLPVDEANVS